MRRFSRTLAGVTFVTMMAFGVAACDGDGDGQPDIDITLPAGAGEGDAGAGGGETTGAPAPGPEPTAAPAPQPTEAPAPQPTEAPVPAPTEAPVPDGGDDLDDAGSGNAEAWLVLLGIIAVGAILAVVLASRRHAGGTAGPDRRRELVATAGWVHDQLTLEILAMPPVEAQRRWAVERSRVDQLAIDGRTMASGGYREMWEQLGSILVQLSSSIDTALRMAAMNGADPALVTEAVQHAQRHRAELGAWVATARTLT
ncbi:MAG: hypothetical protein CL424_07475 [Acidimicrobiaceae bacterium]|nr:hypothetical protein [Acidimicrobiaceae bacterium]